MISRLENKKYAIAMRVQMLLPNENKVSPIFIARYAMYYMVKPNNLIHTIRSVYNI